MIRKETSLLGAICSKIDLVKWRSVSCNSVESKKLVAKLVRLIGIL